MLLRWLPCDNEFNLDVLECNRIEGELELAGGGKTSFSLIETNGIDRRSTVVETSFFNDLFKAIKGNFRIEKESSQEVDRWEQLWVL